MNPAGSNPASSNKEQPMPGQHRLRQYRVITLITLRAMLGRKRALLLAVPPLALIAVALAMRAGHPGHASWPAAASAFEFSVVLPLTALVIGTGVLGAEIDDGTIITVLATPVRRPVIIEAKYAVATAATIAIAAVPELLAGLIAGGSRLAAGLFAGAAAGAAIYSALFLALSVLSARAVAIGLAYVLIWEGLLANAVSGARLLSAGQYALGIAQAAAHDPALGARLGVATSAVMGALVIAAALTVASAGLAAFSLRGEHA